MGDIARRHTRGQPILIGTTSVQARSPHRREREREKERKRREREKESEPISTGTTSVPARPPFFPTPRTSKACPADPGALMDMV